MCPCVAYHSKLRTNCLTYSTSTNGTSVLCGWAGRAIIMYSHSGGNYSARLSVWSGDLRCILSSLKLKATRFNFWPSQKSLDGSRNPNCWRNCWDKILSLLLWWHCSNVIFLSLNWNLWLNDQSILLLLRLAWKLYARLNKKRKRITR